MPEAKRERQFGQCLISFKLSILAISSASSGSSAVILFLRLFLRRFSDAAEPGRERDGEREEGRLLDRGLGVLDGELSDSSGLSVQSAMV